MSFKYSFEKTNMNVRQDQWMEFLCELDFEIKHVRGKENKIANALIRKFHVTAISIFKIDFRENILEA